MTSQINTNGIDTNYPVPGQNNSSQGFRDNFSQIRTNLNTASAEITDLQGKVVLKAALDNTVLNNDMANTLISNASVQSFRHTTYNLGNSLSGTVLVDASRADHQFGSVQANTTLQFGRWAPTNTKQTITLNLSVANSNAVISFPNAAIGVSLLENYSLVGNTATITAPANVTSIELDFTTTDCGNTILVSPASRPYQSTQIINRIVPPTGLPGDVNGTVAVGPSVNQLSISSSNSADYFTTSGNTTQLYLDLPVVFTGTSMEANITIGTTYYVRNVVSSNTFTVSSSIGGANVNLAGNASPTSSMYANPASYLYICTDTFDSTIYPKTVTATFAGNLIQLSTTNDLAVNAPIIFSGNVANTNIVADSVYYIKSIVQPNTPNGNITISATRTGGTAGSAFAVAVNGTLTMTANAYVGSDIWKRIALTSW